MIIEGELEAGDSFKLRKTDQDFASIAEVFTVWHAKERPNEVLLKALASPISAYHRGEIQSWYDAQSPRNAGSEMPEA